MTELEQYRPPDRDPAALTFASVPDALALAERIAGTEFVPKDLRNRPEAVLAAMLTGAELGLPPMSSLSKIHVVDGRPSIAAELMRALVLRAGHELWIEASSNTAVTLGGRRAGQERPTRITWTIDDARNAGLDRKQNWRSYPRAMLVARATGELCRILFADVLAGISYTREEVADGFELDEDAIAAPDAPTLPARPEDVAEAPAPRTTRRAADLPGEADVVDAELVETPKPKGRRKPDPAPAPPPPPLPGEDGIPARSDVVDAELVDHVSGDTVPGPPSGPTYTPAQALAIRAREVGLDDHLRRGTYAAVSSGRARSGKDLTREELEAVFELLTQYDDDEGPEVVIYEDDDDRWTISVGGAVVFDSVPRHETPGENPEAAPVEVPPADENADPGAAPGPGAAVPADEATWKTFLRSGGAKVADALRAAAALSGDPKAAPVSLAALAADPDLSARVAAYLAGEASS